ncbi:hypothetical protein [Stutzerimonas tarimensis]|uniref:Lipoprotein n=1 Tax=Stutzerimonas tarimensis TaxID=1507735 RepID=A0ABV7T806_9GAMM
MMPDRSIATSSALLCGALFIAGCANSLPQRSEHETLAERKLIDYSLHFDIGEQRVLEMPQRRIRIRDQKVFEVTDVEVTRRYDRFTPYQPWRELYEAPLGSLAIVAGVGANLANVVALGQLPESATRGWINYGFAGVNPFLNVESNRRSQQRLAHRHEHRSEPRLEYLSQPWSERLVMVEAGEDRYPLSTDRNGVLRLNLLDAPFSDHDFNHTRTIRLEISDPRGQAHAEATLNVSRDLRQRLSEAHDLILDDLEGDDVRRWVYRVKRLEELSLEEEASGLEQSLIELTRNDPELQQEFVHQLRLSRLAVAQGSQ